MPVGLWVMRTAESVVLTDWPPGPGGAVDVDLQVVRVDLDLDLLGLGQHRDGRRRGVDAALRLGLRHPLHAVRAALVLEDGVGAVALDREGDLLEAADLGGRLREHLGREAAPLGVAGEHPVEVAGEQRRLVAARSRPGSRRSRSCRRWGRARPSPGGSPPRAPRAAPGASATTLRSSGSSPSSASSSRAPSRSSLQRQPLAAPARARAPARGTRARPRRSAPGRRSPPGRTSAARARRSGPRSGRRGPRSRLKFDDPGG